MNQDDKSNCNRSDLIDSNSILSGIRLRNNKGILSEICPLLEINYNILLMLKDRCTIEAINNGQSTFE